MSDISCRNTVWLVELCLRQGLTPQLLLSDIPYTLEDVSNPENFIDWRSYCGFISNFRKYLSLDDLVDASSDSLYHSGYRYLRLIAGHLYKVEELYRRSFGNRNLLFASFPGEISVIPLAKGHLTVVVSMDSETDSCETFYYILMGQIKGIPLLYGGEPAKVRFFPSQGGARFEVNFSYKKRPLAFIRKWAMLPLNLVELVAEITATRKEITRQHADKLALEYQTSDLKRKLNEKFDEVSILTSTVDQAIVLWNDQAELVYANDTLARLSGYPLDHIMNCNWRSLFASSATSKMEQILKDWYSPIGNIKIREERQIDTELAVSSGDDIPVRVRFLTHRNRITGSLLVKGLIESNLEKSQHINDWSARENTFRAISWRVRDSLLSLDNKGDIIYANSATSDIFGYPTQELMGLSLQKLIPRAPVSDGSDGAVDFRAGEGMRAITKDSEHIMVDLWISGYAKGDDIFYNALIIDRTRETKLNDERIDLEHQLKASQKMEAVGQLAGGIAHDFNNLLVAIIGYAELAEEEGIIKTKQNEYIRHIKDAGERAAEMTRKLLAFSRYQVIESKSTDLNQLIDSLQPIIRRLLPASIRLSFEPSTEPVRILADAGQIEQVLVNLAVNARDAMPDGGDLMIQTGLKWNSNRENNLSNTPQVHLSVKDEGEGMTEEIQSQIFEPFYTTKAEGEGTGLGLSVVYGIIKQHKGTIEVESRIGRGTTINICFPSTRSEAKPVQRKPAKSNRKRNESIMVVEDDAKVRDLARLILTGSGYRVTVCKDAETALKTFHDNRGKFDLIFLDVVMPKKGGREVMDNMLKLNPKTRFLFTSGYSSRGPHSQFISEMSLEFIAKPYNREELTNKIDEVLSFYPDHKSANK